MPGSRRQSASLPFLSAPTAQEPNSSTRSDDTRSASPLLPLTRAENFSSKTLSPPPRDTPATHEMLFSLQRVFRGLTLLFTLLILLQSAWRAPLIFLSPVSLGLLACGMTLLLLAKALPLSSSRERPLTFCGPLVFALTCWFSPFIAGCSAWIACEVGLAALPHAVKKQRNRRAMTRLEAAQWILSAYAAEAMKRAFLARTGGTGSAVAPVTTLIAAVALSALTFVVANIAFSALSQIQSLALAGLTTGRRIRSGHLALVYALGLLPVVLTTPMGAQLGPSLGLPFLFLLLMGLRVARLTADVQSLRGQLRTAEEMGRASVHDPDVIDPAVLLQRFLALAKELVPSERSLVWVIDAESGKLTPDIALPDKGPFARMTAMYGEGLIGHVAARMKPRLVADAARDPHRLPTDLVNGAWLLYPIVVHEQLLGVAQWTRPVSQPFTQEDIVRLASLVPQAAIALENVQIREQIHELASTDGLTGLWNHRRMYELLREEIRRATRYHRALSVLMMDVDSFKTFNDSYGHPMGDELLRRVAGILQASVRNVDFAGRYGGEEFLILLPETSKDDACRLAERIRAEVEANAFVVIEGREIHRTVSVGVAAYPEDALNPAELVQRADEALYSAKRAGKNCVIWA